MIKILYPELQPLVEEYPIGLRVVKTKIEELPLLIIKAPKEFLLAARINKGFKIYVVPLQIDDTETIGLMSAFFDNPDEPLCIKTPCFEDVETTNLMQVLYSGSIEAHLVDELGRQLLGYPAKISIPSSTRDRLRHGKLLRFSTLALRDMLNGMEKWFGLRNSSDDAEAISIDFAESLFPENIAIIDMNPALHSYNGGKGFRITMLEREEPGSFQERDIVELLQRIFPPEQIFLGPLRLTDREEICDVLVITDVRVLVIQAKDSPNIEAVMRKDISKKRSTIMRHLTKAIKQVKGAIGYIQASITLKMLISGEEVSIDLMGKEIVSLIVVRELFSDQYGEYSPPILDLVKKTEIACIPLDYMELHMYTMHLDDEDAFFAAFYQVFNNAIARGEFPRLRFKMP